MAVAPFISASRGKNGGNRQTVKEEEREDKIIIENIRNWRRFILLVTLALEDSSSEAEQQESLSPLESEIILYLLEP